MANEIAHKTAQQGEIILYQPDETVRLEVRLEDDTVWLTQAQIVALFQKAKSTISFHISNIFKEGELDEKVVVRKNRTTTLHGAIDGKKQTHEDETVLTQLDKRTDGVTATIYTQHVSQQLQLDIDRHNAQYSPIIVEHFNRAHDRFLLIDDEVYHIGASLKDLGKKWFAFTLMRDLTATELISRISGSATVNIQQ